MNAVQLRWEYMPGNVSKKAKYMNGIHECGCIDVIPSGKLKPRTAPVGSNFRWSCFGKSGWASAMEEAKAEVEKAVDYVFSKMKAAGLL